MIFASLARYTVQLLLVYPITLIAGIPFFILGSKWGFDGTVGHGVTFAGFGALICFYMGSIVGWISGKWIPSLLRTGLWIWLMPTAFVLYDIVPALVQPGAAPKLWEYIYATGDNEGLGVFLQTLPVSSAIGYSVGMLLVGAERIRPMSTAMRMGVLIVWVATFAAACNLMHGIERRMVERDRKLRVAIRLHGTTLASDANGVCNGRLENSIVLHSVTELESLEHSECPGGPTGRDFGIERVRVLDGPNKGLEGWVVTSQVWRPLPLP